MTVGEPSLVDTNVLVYALYADSSHHHAAQTVVERALDVNAGYFVTPQVLFELFSVVTNPRRVTVPMATEEAIETIDVLLGRPGIQLLPVQTDVVARCMRLCRERRITGRRIFDVQLAASMLCHGIKRIITFNKADFERIEGIEVVVPGVTES